MLKKILKIILFCFFVAANQTVLASSQEQIKNDINKVFKGCDPNINVGVVVYSLDYNETLYKKNSNQLFVPASSLKIFPAVAGLTFLGADYKFQTKILTTSRSIENGTINGDVYFYFDGDPSITNENISDMVKELVSLGVEKIEGNVYIDDTIFDNSLIAPGWVWEDLDFCFAAPISATMIDKNCITLKLESAQEPELPAVITNNNINYITINNDIVSTSVDSNDCSLDLSALNDNGYHLSGCIKVDSPQVDLLVAVHDVRLYTSNSIFNKMKESNVVLQGGVGFKKSSSDTPLKILVIHESETLSEIIKPMLKKSDNTVADTIYKKLGSVFFDGKSASWKDGAKAIEGILASKTNIDFKKMYMDDGSGLSRYDLVTPTQLLNVLKYAYYDQLVKRPFIDSLPNAGTDGTLEHRMADLKNLVYAKTGTMKGVSSLTGYIKTKTRGTVSFVIIINSFVGGSKEIRELQDDFCAVLADS